MSQSQRIKFNNRENSEFYPVLKKRVDNYFAENKLSINANGFMVFKTVFFMGGLILFYSLLLSGMFQSVGLLILAILIGFFSACIGFNISHDAVHGSYSSNPSVNRVIGFAFNLLGANAYVWKITHNIVHHTYTNIPGADEDIEVAPLIRLSSEKPLWKIHKFQHIYAFAFYCFASLFWVLSKDYKKFFQKNIGAFENKSHPTEEYFILFFSKLVYYFIFIALPLIVLDIPFWMFIVGFLASHFVEGFTLAIVFQLAHVVEGPEFPNPKEDGTMENAWAIHQMKTTANFSRKSFLANFLFGGLNYQVEHHLFPQVCHVHYPQISEIVKSTAEEFGVPYHDNPTMWDAIKSHVKVLKRYGSGEDLMESDLQAAA